MTETSWREVAETLEIRQALHTRQADNQLSIYRPYPFQVSVHEALDAEGNPAMQRLLMAANRVGKTRCGSREVAIHATGQYPVWWTGYRATRPRLIWVGGVNNDKTRDIGQKELLGDPHDPDAFGTGAIPKRDIVRTVRKPGVPNAFEAVVVKHKGGFNVTVVFKSYDAGSPDWMGEAVDFIWLDEEPPPDIWAQCLTRTVDTAGRILMTFTPESGATQVVLGFMNELLAGQQLYRATWDDAPHMTEERKAQILAAMPEHEREMRSRGEPMLGSGMVFPIPDDQISCPSFDIPGHWARGNGLDIGWDHPTACAFMAHDRDVDTIYVYHVYRQSKATPPIHAAAIKAQGEWIPTAWPRDALHRDKGSGISIAAQYRTLGVNMLPTHATNPPTVEKPKGDEAIEPGLMEMLTRMQTGRLKIFEHLAQWFEEKRGYHRKDGILVKLREDLMSATRYGIQSRRFWQAQAVAPPAEFALGRDYDPLASHGG